MAPFFFVDMYEGLIFQNVKISVFLFSQMTATAGGDAGRVCCFVVFAPHCSSFLFLPWLPWVLSLQSNGYIFCNGRFSVPRVGVGMGVYNVTTAAFRKDYFSNASASTFFTFFFFCPPFLNGRGRPQVNT